MDMFQWNSICEHCETGIHIIFTSQSIIIILIFSQPLEKCKETFLACEQSKNEDWLDFDPQAICSLLTSEIYEKGSFNEVLKTLRLSPTSVQELFF